MSKNMILKGKAHKYGTNVNTDEIIPARYLNTSDPDELAKYCMEDIDKDFVKKVKPGDFIVAGDNFGCGSSREHAPVSIKHAGVSAVIAKSFARIFFRNSINIGLPILESVEASNSIKSGDKLEVDLVTGVIKNITKDEVYHAQAFPEFMQEIIRKGGLLECIKTKFPRNQKA
jgi:3-isopropylmalate/(R)-2-methylmalate dehydratase small subunit